MPTGSDAVLRLPPPDRVLDQGGLYARIYGAGPPLLLIHGNHGSGLVFCKVLRPLARRFTAILADLPEHGNGPAPPSGFRDNPQLAVDYCYALMDKLGIREYHVAGHSLGGMIGLLMCMERPGAVASLVMMDSFVTFRRRKGRLLNIDAYPGNPPQDQLAIDDAFDDGPGVDWHESFDVSGRIADVHCPVLELLGENYPGTEDLYAQWQEAERRGYPENWGCVRIKKAGHFLQLEQPQATVEQMMLFYERHHLMGKPKQP